MPVGNSDRGVGLWAGQIMFGLDNAIQYIDWWHDVLPGSNETFDHKGSLTSLTTTPTLTFGLSNYWNLTISKTIGKRTMGWNSDSSTIHHRDEGTDSDFLNAVGGAMGDTKLMLRYLVFNDGLGPGKRWFLGSGIVIPSKNTLTSDPFFLSGEDATDHRHFSLSDGVYKQILEIQFFKKRTLSPVFIGGTLMAEIPLLENKYGFKSSQLYDLSLTAFSKLIPKINASLGGNIIVRHTTPSYWNGLESPNSRATIVTLGGGTLWNLSVGGIGLTIQKPFFVGGAFSGIEGEVDQRIGAWQLSLSYRKLFDYLLPWIDPLKNL